MAFHLSKDELGQRDMLLAALRDAGGALAAAVNEFNAAARSAWTTVEQAQSQYNATVVEAQNFVDAVADARNAEFEARPEAWQDGEAGQNVYRWLEEWSVVLEDSDLEAPDPIEVGDLEGTEFAELPVEPPGSTGS